MKNYNFLPNRYLTHEHNKIRNYKKLILLLVLLNIFSFSFLYNILNKTKADSKVNPLSNELNSTIGIQPVTETTYSKTLLHTEMLISELKSLNVIVSSVLLSGKITSIELSTSDKEQYYNTLILVGSNKYLKLVGVTPISNEYSKLHFKIALEEVK